MFQLLLPLDEIDVFFFESIAHNNCDYKYDFYKNELQQKYSVAYATGNYKLHTELLSLAYGGRLLVYTFDFYVQYFLKYAE